MSPSSSSDEINLVNLTAVEQEFKSIVTLFEQKETEETWIKFEDAINRLIAITKGSSAIPGFVPQVRKLKNVFQISLKTERTRLARVGLAFVETLAEFTGPGFEQLSDIILPLVIKLTSRANNVYVRSSHNCLKSCIKLGGLASSIPVFAEFAKNSSKTMRIACADCLVLILTHNSSHSVSHHIGTVEGAIREGILDPDSKVRELSRSLFELFRDEFPSRLDNFVDTLPDTARKYLNLERLTSSSGSSGPTKRDKLIGAKKTFQQQRSLQQLQSVIPAVTSSLLTSNQATDLLLATNPSNESSPSSSPIPPIGSMTATTNPTGSISATRALLEKPSRVAIPVPDSMNAISKAPAPSRIHSSIGPMRVVRAPEKPPSTETAKPKMRAQRVPLPPPTIPSTENEIDDSSSGHEGDSAISVSTSVTGLAQAPNIAPAAESSLPTRRPLSRTIVSKSANATVKRNVSGADDTLKKPSFSSHSNKPSTLNDQFDLSTIIPKTTSHDWSERDNAFSAIVKSLNEESRKPDRQSTKISSKLVNAILAGMNDPHFKVVQSSLLAASSLLSLNLEVSQLLVEKLLPKIAMLYYTHHSTQRSGRAAIFDVCDALLSSIRDAFMKSRIKNAQDSDSSTLLLSTTLHLLNQPETMGSIKTRAGLVLFLSTLQDEEWGGYLSKPQNVKTAICKVSSFVLESDTYVQKRAVSVLSRIYSIQPVQFAVVFSGLHQAEKTQIDKIVGAPVESAFSFLQTYSESPSKVARDSPSIRNVRTSFASPHAHSCASNAPKSSPLLSKASPRTTPLKSPFSSSKFAVNESLVFSPQQDNKEQDHVQNDQNLEDFVSEECAILAGNDEITPTSTTEIQSITREPQSNQDSLNPIARNVPILVVDLISNPSKPIQLDNSPSAVDAKMESDLTVEKKMEELDESLDKSHSTAEPSYTAATTLATSDDQDHLHTDVHEQKKEGECVSEPCNIPETESEITVVRETNSEPSGEAISIIHQLEAFSQKTLKMDNMSDMWNELQMFSSSTGLFDAELVATKTREQIHSLLHGTISSTRAICDAYEVLKMSISSFPNRVPDDVWLHLSTYLVKDQAESISKLSGKEKIQLQMSHATLVSVFGEHVPLSITIQILEFLISGTGVCNYTLAKQLIPKLRWLESEDGEQDGTGAQHREEAKSFLASKKWKYFISSGFFSKQTPIRRSSYMLCFEMTRMRQEPFKSTSSFLIELLDCLNDLESNPAKVKVQQKLIQYFIDSDCPISI